MIILCLNIKNTVYSNFGLRQFSPLIEALQAKVIVNQVNGGIEARSKYFHHHIEKIASGKKVHLVGYSLAGLDLRYAINQSTHLASLTQSLITVGTPHRGSYLSDMYRQQRITNEFIEPITNVLGVRAKYFEEVNRDNIRDFNSLVTKADNVNYYSIDAETLIGDMSQIYKYTGNFIEQHREKPLFSGSDGVLVHGEGKYGEHLATLSCDHGALVGIPKEHNARQVADIVKQVIQL